MRKGNVVNVRGFARACLAVATGLVFVIAASPAVAGPDSPAPEESGNAAKPAITAPEDGAEIENGEKVTITARVPDSAHGVLTLDEPSPGEPREIATGGGKLSYELALSCPEGADECTPARNGHYTLTLAVDGDDAADQVEFTVRVPPAPPTGVEASPVDPRRVRLTWDRGEEPDLTSYEILRTDDGSEPDPNQVSAEACDKEQCTTTVTLPEDSAGTRVSLAVRARRLVTPGSTDTVTSPASETVTVEMPGQDPSPSPTDTGGNEPPGSTPPPGESRQPTHSGDPGSGDSDGNAPLPGSPAGGSGTSPGLPAPQPLPSPGGSIGVKLPDLAPASNQSPRPTSTRSPVVAPAVTAEGRTGHPRASAPRPLLGQWSRLHGFAFGLALVVIFAHLCVRGFGLRTARQGTQHAQDTRVPKHRRRRRS